jgi:hypothetical protein
MSPEDLSELGLWARKRHNTVFQIARRATDRKTNCKDLWSILIYLAYNPLFRDEMLKKHGMMLGYRGFEREIIHNPVAKKALEQLGENDLAGLSLEGVRKVFTKIAQKLA